MKSIATLHPAALDLLPCEAAARAAHLRDAVFFDSALETRGAISILAAEPREIVAGSSRRDWDILREKVRAAQQQPQADDGAPHGMAAGFVAYDGSFRFGFYEELLVHRHADHSWSERGDFSSRLMESANKKASPRLRFEPEIRREHFCEMVAKAQAYIAAGDIYQVNLAHRFRAPWSGEPWSFYETLRHCSPAPHAVFMRAGGRSILSASPECFLQMSGRRIRTRPIKGTRPRRADADADEKSAFDLITSPKETAELVMITDLERNDLGRVCEYRSVQVRELLKLERFAQVFHLVSTIDGELREEVDHVTALQQCFPGGSITGAPKKRAREIIAELEPAPRGLYTGALGYFGFNGESQFNLAIRTVVIAPAHPAQACFHVGAGIVADSDAEREYQETLDKAAGILFAAGPG